MIFRMILMTMRQMLTPCPFQTTLNIRLGPPLKQNILKDLREVVCVTQRKALDGMHYGWQTYKRNTAESKVKLKLNICIMSVSAEVTE